MPSDPPVRASVLVIDDDEDLRTVIQDVLEDQGFAVEAGILFPPTVSPRNLALLAR